MKGKRIGVIHAYPGRRLLDGLGAAGLRVVLIGNGEAWREHPAVEAVLNVPLWPVEGVFDAVRDYHARQPLDALLPVNEGTVLATAQLAEQLGLAGMPVATAVASRNKYLAALLWEAQGIAVPTTLPLDAHTPWARVREQLGERVVIKLSDSMNSQGVIAVADERQYQAALARLYGLIAQSTAVDPLKDRNRFAYGHGSLRMIAQAYCEGREFGIDVLLQTDGEDLVLAVLEKEGGHGPYFAESASVWPTSCSRDEERQLGALAIRAARGLGLTQGAAHVEIRYRQGMPCVLEAGLRPGGGFTVQVIDLLAGLDVHAAQAGQLLGRPALPTLATPRGAVLFGGVVIERSGVLREVEGLEVFDDMQGLCERIILAEPGDWVQAMPDSAQPHYCYYLIAGEDRQAVLERHMRIQHQIRVHVETLEVEHG